MSKTVVNSTPTVVVLTAIPVEHEAMTETMVSLRQETHSAGTIFHAGLLLNSPWRVMLTRTGQGNQQAAVIAERAISHYRPDLVMMVGVAGGLHTDLSLGDVVVAEKVYAVHGGKAVDAGFQARPRVWFPHHGHVQRAELVASENTWQNALPDRPEAKAVVRPIASGEVVLDSPDSPYARHLKTHYGDAAAVEMEGAGVALAGQLNASVPTVVVRGISDHADGRKEHADRGGGQRRAARNAATFAVALLAELNPRGRSLREQLLYGTSDEQNAAARQLHGSGNPDVVPLLVEGFYATLDHEVSCRIIRALGSTGTARAKAALLQLNPRYHIEQLEIQDALNVPGEQSEGDELP
ncbi:5'-methylthioadenosine/S-adenosylhomocysteine nucleosidase family protein [Amycolatopsis silviterrae]|uniref:Nucleoside phosphorylase domain-containing protein n=1 Tax=Amycolatopsis silviterrae TaxID=1656914 RepID=A0ABW5HP38_9PSEU